MRRGLPPGSRCACLTARASRRRARVSIAAIIVCGQRDNRRARLRRCHGTEEKMTPVNQVDGRVKWREPIRGGAERAAVEECPVSGVNSRVTLPAVKSGTRLAGRHLLVVKP
jgi:hypothetical protein